MLSPEIDRLKAQMTAIILRDSKGFFDDPKWGANLQITVRVTCEFLVFLQQSNDAPELGEAEYMTGIIGSGVDWFFSMAQAGNALTGVKLRRGFGPNLPSTFSELKESYTSVFGQLLESAHSNKALGLLLSLVQMMLLFMAVYFPSLLSFSSKTSSD